MTRAKEALLEEIRERKDEAARLKAEAEQLEATVKTIQERITELGRETTVTAGCAVERRNESQEALRGVTVLQQALTYLQEHGAQAPEPDLGEMIDKLHNTFFPPVEAGPTPAPEPAVGPPVPRPSAPRKGKGGRKPKPDPVKAQRKAAREELDAARRAAKTPAPQGSRYSRDPLKVHEKAPTERRSSVGKPYRPLTADGVAETTRLKFDALSPTQEERAGIVLLEDHDGCLPQYRVTVLLFLSCKPQSAASIVSECLRILKYRGLILYTGEKVATEPGGRLASPVWKTVAAASPPERASAGLGVSEFDFAGRESRLRNEPYKPPVKGHFEGRS